MQSCPGAGCQSVCHFGRSGLHARHHAVTRTPRLSYSPIPPGNHVRRQMCQVDGGNATSRRIPGAIVDKIDALVLCAMSENADAVVRGWASSREFAFASNGRRYLHHFARFSISVTELTAWGLTSGREQKHVEVHQVLGTARLQYTRTPAPSATSQTRQDRNNQGAGRVGFVKSRRTPNTSRGRGTAKLKCYLEGNPGTQYLLWMFSESWLPAGLFWAEDTADERCVA